MLSSPTPTAQLDNVNSNGPTPAPQPTCSCPQRKGRPRQRCSPWRPRAGTHTWCHQMICTEKNGTPRRTIDFQPLNAQATRETRHTQSPFHQAPFRKLKTVFDAWNGYHSVALHPDDRHYTTFITPWGRYRYKTAPQGYISSGDGYTRRYDEIVSDVPQKKCVDDTLLWADTIKEACNWLTLCGLHGITLNPLKFQFASPSVEFAGFEITADSVKPCQKIHLCNQGLTHPKKPD